MVNPETAAPRRFRSLDVLRGLAILGMSWSGMLPDTLPAWMYHGQLPPPNHDFHPEIFGITWVDLIFPMFLFSMGAAIPIAIANRLERGERLLSIVWWLTSRALLLASFSLIDQHLRPGAWTHDPDAGTFGIAIGGFILMALMYGFKPQWKGSRWFAGAKVCAWIGVLALVATHVYPDHKMGFANYRQDVILMVLANVAFSGGLIWLATRRRPLLRMAIAVAVGLVFLSQDVKGSVAKFIWDWTPQELFTYHNWNQSRLFPIVYHFEYHKYLLVVLPGTLGGDLILKAIREKVQEEETWNRFRSLGIVLVGFACPIVACIGLFSRQVVPTFGIEAFLSVAVILLSLRPGRPAERLIAGFARLGAVFLMLGLLAEPIGGGIRKDSPTLSYFITTAGLSFMMLASFETLLDWIRKPRLLKFTWMVGMNPMLGYAAITNLVSGAAGLSGYSVRLAATSLAAQPWTLAVFDGGVRTLLVGLVAAACTKLDYYLRT